MIINILRSGKIVIYPTDTAYAIGCVYTQRSAIREIMRRKGRTDPKFTIIASSLAQVEKYFRLTAAQRRLAKKYWPGPLSIVVSKRYAVRVPNHPIARQLARRVGAPLLATSVNRSGQPAAFDLRHLPVVFRDVPRIDIGRLPKVLPSTVVEIRRGQLIIHRAGPIQPTL